MWIRLTRFFMLGALIVILAYDVIARYWGGSNATISNQFGVLVNASADGKYLVFVLGLLVGHLMGEVQSRWQQQ